MIKIYILIIGILLLLVTSGSCYWFYKEWRDAVREKKSLEQLNGTSFKTVEHYKNKYGEEIVKNNSLRLESSTIKQLAKEGQLPILKEFDGLKKSYRNLLNVIQAQIIVKKDTIIKDVTLDHTFGYSTEFEAFKETITKDSTGKLNVSIQDSILVPLNGVLYWHRKWFLGHKDYRVEATSPNKKVTITGLESIQVIKE